MLDGRRKSMVPMAERLQVPFEVLSDAAFEFCETLRLPTFDVEGRRLLKRLTLVVADDRIEHVFYPVFPTDTHADEVLRWLSLHPRSAG